MKILQINILNASLFLSGTDIAGIDHDQQDDAYDDPVITPYPEAVFFEEADKEFDGQHGYNEGYYIANHKQLISLLLKPPVSL